MIDPAVLSALNTLVTSYFAKKFNFDNVSFTALSTISSFLIAKIASHDYSQQLKFFGGINRNTLMYFCIVFFCLILVFFKQKIELQIKKLTFKQHFKLEIESDRAIDIFSKYVEKYSEMFDLPTSYVLTPSGKQRSSEGIIVNFFDKNLNLRGYYVVIMTNVFDDGDQDSNQKKILQKRHVIHLYIQKHETVTTMNYIDTIEKYVSSPLELYAVKSYEYTQNSTRYLATSKYQIYSGDLLKSSEIEKKFIEPFFHPQKTELWKQIQYVNSTKNNSSETAMQLGFILYGPPGTGKSRFAYTMALATNRHIVSLDILSFRKSRLYNLFKSPEVNGKTYTPADVIFVFDEFDITVMTLHEKELTDEKIAKSNQRKMDEYEKKLQLYFDSFGKLNENGEPLVPEPVQPSSNILTLDRGANDSSQNLTVRSLLELIQGPVPLKGAIFIATTNEFDKIHKICPALFRTGRLTPVYFGNAESDTLQEMSIYYYKKKLNIESNLIATIPTSEIINFITCHQLENNYEFDKFEKYIIKNTKPIDSIKNNN